MRAGRDRAVRFLVVVIAVAAVGLGAVVLLSDDGDDGDAAGGATPCPAANGRTSALRDCLGADLAVVETPYAIGSGVLLPDGHIVTNAHVIDPYATADVTFPGGEHHQDVEVVGVDAFADVAVLGPIETEREGLRIAPLPPLDVEGEPEVFLAGYPGGIEGDDPQVTLAGGVLSRLRELETFGQTYLQTDAAIAGGQSGGVLVDTDGRVLGLSGLGFAEEFALALSSTDVLEAVEAVLAGDGSERRVIPDADELATSAQLPFDDERNERAILIPADEGTDDRTVHVTVPPDRPLAISVYDLSAFPIMANPAALTYFDLDPGEAEDFGLEIIEPDESGTYTLELFAAEDVIVSFQPTDGNLDPVDVTSDADFAVLDFEPPTSLEPDGVPHRAVLNVFDGGDDYTFDLEEGDRVEITVRSPQGDMYYDLVAPGEELDLTTEPDADDGGGGLYDLDARETHDIEATGTYRVRVNAYDGVIVGYEVIVELVD